MTEKPNKQLFNGYALAIGLFILGLVVFFIYAASFDAVFFYVLISGILVMIGLSIPTRLYISQKQAELSLQSEHIQEQVNLLDSEIVKQEMATDSFKDKIVNFSQLKGLTENLSMCLSIDETSRVLAAEVNRLFGGKESTIILYLFHSKTGELGISLSQKGQMKVNLKSKKGDLFDQWVVKNLQPLLIEDIKSDYRFDISGHMTEETRPVRSLISVPLLGGSKALGILRIDSPSANEFSTSDLRFLTTIADLGAIAVENAQLYEHVEQMAIRDGLTGLYLRRYLLDRIPEEIARHMKAKQSFAFFMIDLDKFKQYNDTLGHMAGDIVLRTLGMMMNDCFHDHPGTLIGRYGGEEFCILVPYCDRSQAINLAESLRKKVEQQAILLRRQKTYITISVGLTMFPDDAVIKEDLISKADQALYLAKRKGRNRVCVA